MRQLGEAAIVFVKNNRKVLVPLKIQRKIALIFAAGIITFILAGILANYFLLEKYYIYKTEREFIVLSKEMQKKIESRQKDLSQFIIRYGKRENVRILILNPDLEVEEISYYRRERDTNVPLNKIEKLIDEKGEKNYICRSYEQKRSESVKMIFVSETKQGNYLVFMKNTKGVQKSAAIANEFYFIIGGIVLLVALFSAHFLSVKISRPLVRMNEVTREMAELHFEQKIPEKGGDEIAELAHCINQMSDRLCDSISVMERDILQRKQLIRDLSHELKTPIAVIMGYADALRYGVAQNADEQKKYCGIIADECDRMDRMVRELLELSRLEQINYALTLEKISLYRLAEELSTKYDRQMRQKKCSFSIQGEKSVEVEADRKLLECIVDNLLGNAAKYVDAHGRIEMSVYEDEQNSLFSIYNTCGEISQDKLERVWDGFFKLDDSRKREQGGHGIGLAIVKTAVELHGGTVSVENCRGGIVFGCTFPKKSAHFISQ